MDLPGLRIKDWEFPKLQLSWSVWVLLHAWGLVQQSRKNWHLQILLSGVFIPSDWESLHYKQMSSHCKSAESVILIFIGCSAIAWPAVRWVGKEGWSLYFVLGSTTSCNTWLYWIWGIWRSSQNLERLDVPWLKFLHKIDSVQGFFLLWEDFGQRCPTQGRVNWVL